MKRPAVALLIGIFLFVVVLGAGYFLLVGPKNKDIDKLAKEIEDIDTKVNEEKSKYSKLIDIKNRLPEYEAKLAAVEAMIPAEPELPSLIRNIQAAADPGTGAGIPWVSFTPGEVAAGQAAAGQPAAGQKTGAGFSSYSLSISCAGCYSQVVDFIYRLERMQRAIVIDGVTLTPTSAIFNTSYSQNLGLVSCQLTAKTFTFAAPAGGAATTAPAATPETKK
ncbi:MAG: type 4a pilus biogenesis protein PilO [Actinomycetota bacterium]|nr:type 4a pilus biogenesis protein PilO [Actinomycetota bacterium]